MDIERVLRAHNRSWLTDADAEQWQAERDRIKALEAENARLREALRTLAYREHFAGDETYSACPKAHSPAFFPPAHLVGVPEEQWPCDCGAGEHNARVDAALTPHSTESYPTPPRATEETS